MENSEQTKGENSTMRARKGWEILLLPSSSQPLSRGSNTGMGSQIDLNKHFSIISQIGKDAAPPPKLRQKIERASGGRRERGWRQRRREEERRKRREEESSWRSRSLTPRRGLDFTVKLFSYIEMRKGCGWSDTDKLGGALQAALSPEFTRSFTH